MLEVPSWFLCAQAASSSPQRVSSPGVRLRHTAFAQKRSQNGFQRLKSTQIGALLTTAISSPQADSWLAQHLPDAQLVMYPDASHGAQSQHAGIFLEHA